MPLIHKIIRPSLANNISFHLTGCYIRVFLCDTEFNNCVIVLLDFLTALLEYLNFLNEIVQITNFLTVKAL